MRRSLTSLNMHPQVASQVPQYEHALVQLQLANKNHIARQCLFACSFRCIKDHTYIAGFQMQKLLLRDTQHLASRGAPLLS